MLRLQRTCEFYKWDRHFLDIFFLSYQEEDFATEEEYNDYLEEMECIVYNLCNNIDIVNTNKKIEQYKKDNRDLIMKNKSRLGREEYELELELEREKQLEADRKKELQQIEQDLKKRQLKEKEALIDELMSSHADAASIVSDYAKQAEKIREEAKVVPVNKNEFSTGVKFGQQAFLPLPKVEEGPMYVYQKPIIISDGPQPPKPEEIESKGYIQFIRYARHDFVFTIPYLPSFCFPNTELRMPLNELVDTDQSFPANVHCKKHYKDYSILNNFGRLRDCIMFFHHRSDQFFFY